MSTAPLATAQGVWLVAEREMSSKLRSKAYIISAVILLLIALGSVIWSGIAAGSNEQTAVAATSDTADVVGSVPDVKVTDVADRAEAEKLITDGTVEAAVLTDPQSPTGLLVLADTEAPTSLVSALSQAPTVELLNGDDTGPLRYILGLVFGIVFMMAGMSFGIPIATSVVEEKQTRVVEVLLSAIPPRVLLAGKVLGNTILALAQILLLIAVVVVGMAVTGQKSFLQDLGGPILWFAVFFLFGFILLAALFAAAGSMVSRQEDTGPTVTPVMYLTMIPYFLVVFLGDNPTLMTVLSYIPFSAPVAMPVRLFFGEAEPWEPLVSLAIMLATCAVVILLGSKIYENALLKMGARVKFRDALRS